MATNKMEPPRSERLTGANLLVVEDELMLLLELESVLCDAGADKVVLSRSAGDALARAREEPLSAAILDVRAVVTGDAKVITAEQAREALQKRTGVVSQF